MKGAIAAVVIGFVLAVAALAVGAKWLTPKEPLSAPQITVTGESRLVGEPDTAVVSFGVTKSAKTVVEGQKLVSELISKVIEAVQEAGVKKEDMRTSYMSISQDWDYKKNRPSGYSVSSTLTITVRNVQHVGRIVDTAVASGLNRLKGVSYDVRSSKWKQKGMREALQNARKRAEDMAKGVGRPLGRVVSVRERAERQTSPGGYGRWRWGDAVAEAFPPREEPITRALPGQQALHTQVQVVYEL